MEGAAEGPRTPSAGTGGFARARVARVEAWRRRNAPLGARRAGPPGPPSRGEHLGKNQQGRRTARVRHGDVRFGRLGRRGERGFGGASRRARVRRGEARDADSARPSRRPPPTARRTRLPPCACVAGTSTRSRSRGARRRARPRAWTRAGDRRGSRSVARSTPTATGTWCGGTSARPRATRRGSGRDRGMRTGVVDDRSPSRLRRGIATRTATRTSPRPSRTFTTTHRPLLATRAPRARARRLARAAVRRPAVLRPGAYPGCPRVPPRRRKAAEPLAGPFRSERARLRAKRRGRCARGAGRRRARPARRARALGGEDARARAAGDARGHFAEKRARYGTSSGASPALAAVDGDEAGSMDLEALERADLDARARRCARRPRRNPRSCARSERDGVCEAALQARARARARRARAAAAGARARAARPSAAAASSTTQRARFCQRVCVHPDRAPQEASAARGVATRDAVRGSDVSGRGKPRPGAEPGAETAEPLSHARFARPERAREEPFGARRDDPPNDGERT